MKNLYCNTSLLKTNDVLGKTLAAHRAWRQSTKQASPEYLFHVEPTAAFIFQQFRSDLLPPVNARHLHRADPSDGRDERPETNYM